MMLLILLFAVVLGQDETSWQKYITGPQSSVVYPKSIVSYSGYVVNPTGLLPDGDGDTVLIRTDEQGPAAVIVDFGTNLVGFLSITFNGASDNTPGLRIAFSETQQYLSDLSDFSRSNSGNSITPGSDQVAVQSTPYTWANSWGCAYDGKVCSDGLHGFRYVKLYIDALESDAPITSKTGSINIASISLAYSGFLATPDTFQGWFESSDEKLNQFWYSGVYTNDMTTDIFRSTDCDPRGAASESLEGRLVLYDGAKRDRDPYVGDVAVSGRTAYLSHGSLTSDGAANVLADLGDHQRDDGWIPPASINGYTLPLFDYPLWWVLSIWEYVLYTGNTQILEKYFPSIVRVLNDYYPAHDDDQTKIISRPGGMGDYAFIGRDGEVAYYNALYVLALQSAAESAIFLGENQTASDWLQRAEEVKAGFDDKFWDDPVGAYKNSPGATTSHPQDGNSLAILAGIPSSQQATRILSYLNRSIARPYGNAFMDDDSVVGGGSQRVYAFISTFELQARFKTNQGDSAVEEIKRLCGWMLTHDPGSTYWEGIGADGSMYEGGFMSAAHGWSTGVVGLLTNYVLGLTPLKPGGIEYLFYVIPTSLEWAKGQVPTIAGPLISGWTHDPSGTYNITISSPVGTIGKAVVPVNGGEYKVMHNGEKIWDRGTPFKSNVRENDKGHVTIEEIHGGSHTITAIKT